MENHFIYLKAKLLTNYFKVSIVCNAVQSTDKLLTNSKTFSDYIDLSDE